jgi:ABC-2 type transport system permease protein
MTVLARLLADRRRGAIGWAVGTLLGVAAIVGLWPSVEGNTDLEQVVEDLPETMQALIGSQADIPLTSAAGYLQARLISTILPILLLVYGIGLGARTIGAPEEDGTLQLVMTGPITRRRVAVERFAGAALLLVAVCAVGLLTAIGLGALVGLFSDLAVGRLVLATVAVAELAFLHMAIAAAVGAATGRRAPAVATASAVAVGGYLLHGLAASADALRPARVLSPWWWLLDRNLLVQDPTFLALGLPLLLATIPLVAGLIWFERRDLRFP